MSATDSTVDRHPAQWLALAIGVVYTIVGLAGFFLTGFDGFAAPEGGLLLGIFEVNPLHNIVHLTIGLAGLALWSRLDRARVYGWLLAAGYGLTFVYGLFFACYSSVVTHVALYQRHELKLGFKNFWSAFNPFKWTSKTNEGATQRTEDGAYTDVHNRLMSVYNEGIIPCSIQKAFWLLMYCSPTLVVFHYYGSGDRRRRYWPDCVSNVYHASGTPIWPFALSIVRRACWHT